LPSVPLNTGEVQMRKLMKLVSRGTIAGGSSVW
jgi:hypothetical protein